MQNTIPTSTHEKISVARADGKILHAQLFHPAGAQTGSPPDTSPDISSNMPPGTSGQNTPRAMVLINPGIATRRAYYAPFAEFLCQQGFRVCIWNYYGFEQARPESLKQSPIRMLDISQKDIPTLLEALTTRYPELPLICVGHSAGAQQIGLVPNNHLINGLVAVATSAGYAPAMPLDYRLQAHLFFQGIVPLSILSTGYVAAKSLGIMEDLPPQLANEWKAWCKHPAYFFDPRFYGKPDAPFGTPRGNCEQLPFPVRVFTATDDEISSYENVTRLWQHYTSHVDRIRFHWYQPRSLGVTKIKHFGYFRKTFKDTIWQDLWQAVEELIAQ